MLKMIKKIIADRLDEKSTLRALTLLFGFIGWKISPENSMLIVEVVMSLLVFFGVMPDKKKTPAEIAKEAEEDRVAEIAALKKRAAELEGTI